MKQASNDLAEAPIRSTLAEIRGKLAGIAQQPQPDRESIVAVVSDMRAHVDGLDAEVRSRAAGQPELPAALDAMLLAFDTLRQALDMLGAAAKITPDRPPLRRTAGLPASSAPRSSHTCRAASL